LTSALRIALSPDVEELNMNDIKKIDLKGFSERLAQYRKSVGKTQEQVADHLGMSRPTYIALEKGNRAPTTDEIIKLGELLNRTINELVRPGLPVKLEPHLRAGVDAGSKDADELAAAIHEFQRFAEDYRDLELMLSAPLATSYPPEVQLPQRGNLSDFAEGVAARERARLQIGDQPIPNLRDILESEVGIRIFFGSLPSRVAGLYAFVAELGCCMMINSRHPRERQHASLAHEYGHVIVDRHKPGIDYLTHEGRKPANERFVESFAMAFLMPATGIRRHFQDVYNATGDFQVGDLVRLSGLYSASVQAMALRLENLGLLTKGTWDFLVEQGFKANTAKRELNLVERSVDREPSYPDRYKLLAVHAYLRGKITENQLMHLLRCDRIEAREIVAESRQSIDVTPDGRQEILELPFERSLVASR
jgi:Zn-dependent peptidase ImmA (M78 family)/DNA-binding XRE family transcriptional regulator